MQRNFIPWAWYRFCWSVCWVLTKLLFCFRWDGADHVPADGPVLLVSNHQSHLDPVLVGVACPRQMHALARRSLFFGPFGWLLRSVGAVPVNLEGSAVSGLKATLRLLRDANVVLVFPEGTRTVDGSLGRLRPGFCALARRSGAVIVPAAVDGSFAAMPRGRAFPRHGKIHVTFGPPIVPDEYQGLSDDELVELIRSRIVDCLGCGVGGRPSPATGV
jgi:1-acyl-sn-glycerol-3-phosphate acyltransferase